LGFVLVSLLGAHFLGPRQKKGDSIKNQNFECGIEIKGNARAPYSIRYFLTAVLFVLFDIEIVFFYPYAVNFKEFGFEGFLAILTFVAVFFTGFIYVLKRGALDWNK
jgi:NADH-quinone oxidoreductase subunit A